MSGLWDTQCGNCGETFVGNKSLHTDGCVCGWFFRHWSKEHRIRICAEILGVHEDLIKEAVDGMVLEYHPMYNNIYRNITYPVNFKEVKEKQLLGNK